MKNTIKKFILKALLSIIVYGFYGYILYYFAELTNEEFKDEHIFIIAWCILAMIVTLVWNVVSIMIWKEFRERKYK